VSGVPPQVPARRQGFDWSTASIALSIIGALLSIADRNLVFLGVIVFVAGLIVGVIGWRSGLRKNRAVIGIVLNSANLILDAGLVISAASR
jgi:hypothetical protein